MTLLTAAVGRVALALIFLLSGIGKLAAPAATTGYIASAGLPFPALLFWGTIALEIAGGLALVLGYRTRIVAFALAGFSILAAVLFHAQFGDQNQMIHFLKNVAIAGGLLHVAAFGAGTASLDARLLRRVTAR
jgi:putative oxidoreductase